MDSAASPSSKKSVATKLTSTDKLAIDRVDIDAILISVELKGSADSAPEEFDISSPPESAEGAHHRTDELG